MLYSRFVNTTSFTLLSKLSTILNLFMQMGQVSHHGFNLQVLHKGLDEHSSCNVITTRKRPPFLTCVRQQTCPNKQPQQRSIQYTGRCWNSSWGQPPHPAAADQLPAMELSLDSYIRQAAWSCQDTVINAETHTTHRKTHTKMKSQGRTKDQTWLTACIYTAPPGDWQSWLLFGLQY